ncbi:MAG TPA: hypothetical protein VG456_14875 [Candidatus Sulfopaludibacter sp.]|jgi:hypothetical protein|nr:hypothetical protein [Candidatus Sulfopaludibacter sp.]
MNPWARILLIVPALAGAALILVTALPAIRANLTALHSWTRTEGEVRAMSGAIEFELGTEEASHRAFANVDHTWGLSLFKKAPLFIDPADSTRVKPAGLLQMWLAPVEMAGLVLLLLVVALLSAGIGRITAVDTSAVWMFTPSPGPASGGVTLHAPVGQWKIVVGWSMLGVAMAVIVLAAGGGRIPAGMFRIILGAAFAISLWLLAWHTKSMELSANAQGVRLTTVLGWRDVPWTRIRGVQDQHIFTSYYNGQMRMWELPFAGSTTRVLAFTDERGRTVMTFSPTLEPKDAMKQLFALCKQQTGAHLERRDIALPF